MLALRSYIFKSKNGGKGMVKIDEHLNLFKSYDETNNLGLGELIFPGGERFLARYKFFLSINNTIPKVFKELDKFTEKYIQLLPTMQDLSEETKNFLFHWRDILEFSKMNTDCRQFANNLIEWAKSWNLNEEWILSSALLTIYSWNYNPLLREKLIVHPAGYLAEYFNKLGSELDKVKQDPEFPAPPVYLPALTNSEQFDGKVKEYKRNVINIFKSHGWRKSPSKRNREEDVGIERDFEWLVKYQILKQDYKTIVDDHFDTYLIHTNDNTVMRAIDRTAEYVGLTLRKPNKK
jgi:hypothetical protein